mmetsp:Transcript_10522/g.25482  ORF Transcript_10522/g.25482 Transcript_10522/m.25482 type:complete len:229 (-) Transcript_10522:171-857(-)
MASPTVMSPPGSPVPSHRFDELVFPPPAPKRAADPPLLRALRMASLPQVSWLLEEDPEAASSIFIEHRCETPLCAAIRHNCGVDILRILLDHGAEVNLRDCDGFTPLALLSKKPCSYQPVSIDFDHFQATMRSQEQDALCVAQVLLAAGADPLEVAPGGQTCVDLAQSAGNSRLARLLRGDSSAADKIQEDLLQVWTTSDILAAELPLLFEPTRKIASLERACYCYGK